MIIIFFTAILGFIRDFIKYKNISLMKFIRTPILTILFYIIFIKFNIKNSILLAIIFERWFFLVLKSIISFCNNDYIKNKQKYIKKYGLKYKN